MSTARSDEAAFESLFKAEYARVVGIANRVLADPHEAEDVAQDVFVDFHRLHSATAQYAPAWLHRAAAHASLNRLRGARRRQKREVAQALEEGERTLDREPACGPGGSRRRRTGLRARDERPEIAARAGPLPNPGPLDASSYVGVRRHDRSRRRAPGCVCRRRTVLQADDGQGGSRDG